MIPQSFSFTASVNGQNTFGPIVPQNMPNPIIAIQGVIQDSINGDFTISGGFYITLNNGVPAGTRIHGVINI